MLISLLRNFFSASFTMYGRFCRYRPKLAIKGISVECAASYTESLASQGCECVLSCHGTIVKFAMGGILLFIVYFLPKPVFRFIYATVVSPFFRKQQQFFITRYLMNFLQQNNRRCRVQQKCCAGKSPFYYFF